MLLDKLLNSGQTLRAPDDRLLEQLGRGANRSKAGSVVTEDSAMRVSTVWACVRILSFTLGSLPLRLMERDGDTRNAAREHPLYELLATSPNDEMIAMDALQMMMAHLMLQGDAYSEYARDGAGRVREIVPLQTANMNVTRSDVTKRLVFEYADGAVNRIIPNDRLWRVTGLSLNGVTGLTPIGYAREAIGLQISAEEFGADMFGNGGMPLVALEVEQRLDKDQRGQVREGWHESFKGMRSSAAVLHSGAKAKPLSIKAEDAQFIETRKFQQAEICNFYGVPLSMVNNMEKATFNNYEQQNLQFLTQALTPWLVKFEQSIRRDLLTPSERQRYYAKFNVEGLLRADSKARADYFTALHNLGSMSVNEIRAKEDMNPVDGGDSRYMQMAMGRINEDGDIVGSVNGETESNETA